MRTIKKRLITTLLVVGACVFLLPAALVIAVDPFQIYHRPLFKDMGMSDNQRYHNAGLINRYLANKSLGYESIAVGTSMSANVGSDQLEEHFGWGKAVRLILKGGSPAEIEKTILYALDKGAVKSMLLEVNPWHYLDDYEVSKLDPEFPAYLYNKTRLDDYAYVVSIDSLKLSLEILTGDRSSYYLTPETIGRSLYEDFKHSSFNENIKEALPIKTGQAFILKPLPPVEREAYQADPISRHLFPVIDRVCDEDIEVVLFIPPLSRLYYLEQKNRAQAVVYMPRQILQKIQGCENIRLHAFDTMPFVEDLNYYRDSMHYTSETNDWLLMQMARHKGALDVSMMAEYEDQWISRIQHADIKSSYPKKPSWVIDD